MTQIPRAALILGLAGALPFALPVAAMFLNIETPFGLPWETIQSIYALTILAFMSGCIWGFSAKTDDSTGYALSTLPALYGFFVTALTFPVTSGTAQLANMILSVGFLLLLLLDLRATRIRQTPPWWMPLRILLTSLVVTCLLIGAIL